MPGGLALYFSQIDLVPSDLSNPETEGEPALGVTHKILRTEELLNKCPKHRVYELFRRCRY